jgi:hypothetical protein
METIPEELYDNILGFLSVKEKVTVREVCVLFESKIKRNNLVVNRLENKLKRSHSIEKKLYRDLILTTNNNFIMYTDYTQNGVHSLFRINNHQINRCIDFQCREKQLGNIYFSKKLPPPDYHQQYGWNFYSKRNIPYCLNCYNKWG